MIFTQLHLLTIVLLLILGTGFANSEENEDIARLFNLTQEAANSVIDGGSSQEVSNY